MKIRPVFRTAILLVLFIQPLHAQDAGAEGSAEEPEQAQEASQEASSEQAEASPGEAGGDESESDSAPESDTEASASPDEAEASEGATAEEAGADSGAADSGAADSGAADSAAAEADSEEPQAGEAGATEESGSAETPTKEALAPSADTVVTFSQDKLQDIDLLELLATDVSTATKTSESLQEAPAIITAITASEIERWGYQSVGEALQHIVGFYLIDDHITPNAAVRGMNGGLGAESSVVKVMIDGRSVAFRTTSGNWLGVELVPLSAIKQIEVIRGPASALYGADAFLGVVNIITVAPEDARMVDARVTGGFTGDNATGRFDVSSGFLNKNFDFLLTAAGEQQDRTGLRMPSESPAPNVPPYNDPYGESQDLLRRSLVVGARVGVTDPRVGHRATISAYASGMRRGGDFAHWAQLTAGQDAQGRDVGTAMNLGQFRINADLLYQATPTLGVALQSTYFQGGTLADDRVEVGSDLFYVKRKMSYRGVDANLEGRFIPNDRFNLIVGVESIYDKEALPSSVQISKETDEPLGVETVAEKVDLVNLGAFVSSNLKLIDPWLKITGGIRFDQHNRYGSQLSGRAGATSRLSDGLVAKLLYGHAYKAPSPYLQFAEPLVPGDVIGNEELEPQFIDTWEAQISWVPHPYFSGSTGVSYSLLRDKAEFVPEGINQTAQNTATQQTFSWESRVDVKNADLIGGYGSFELTQAKRTSDQEGYQADLVGSENTVYPGWIARGGAYVALTRSAAFPLELTTQAIFVGRRRAADTSILENGGSFYLPTYVTWNAGLASRDLRIVRGQQSSLALRVKNILGTTGPDPGFSGFEYPLTAREIFLELRHRY